MGGGDCLAVRVRLGYCRLKINSDPFLGNHCHLCAILIPDFLSCNDGINLACFWSQRAYTSTWLSWKNHLLYHFGCVNECHTQAIKLSLSQLSNGFHRCYSQRSRQPFLSPAAKQAILSQYKTLLLFLCNSDIFMTMADMPEGTPPHSSVFYVPEWQQR